MAIGNESPYELQLRLKSEAANRHLAEVERTARLQAGEAAAAAYVPPKDPATMTPAEIQEQNRERREREQNEAAAGVEAARKERARRAYVASTGSEEGFEGLYTASIRQKMIQAEVEARLKGDEVAIGQTTADGMVRW
jgi:hypothetical protein